MGSQKTRIASVVLISVVMAALRTVVIAMNMESNVEDSYYLPESLEVTAFSVVTAIFMLLFISLAYSFSKKQTFKLERSFTAVPAGSLILAFSVIFAVATQINMIFKAETLAIPVLELIALAFAALSAVKFLWSGLCYNKKVKDSTHAIAALVPIFFSVFRLLSDFVRSSAAPMASSGSYHLIGLVAVLLYFMAEGRSYVGEYSAVSYYAFGYIAIYFLLVYALPNILLHCFVFCFDQIAAYSVVDVGLAIYIASRLSSAQLVDFSDDSEDEAEDESVSPEADLPESVSLEAEPSPAE